MVTSSMGGDLCTIAVKFAKVQFPGTLSLYLIMIRQVDSYILMYVTEEVSTSRPR